MGKTAKCIQMLQLLRSRKMMTREEIASELDINVRNVGEYKKELSNAGYIIDSTHGIGGGYYLVSGPLLPNLRFSEQEQSALRDGKSLLESQKNFIHIGDYISAMDKIQASYTEYEFIEQVYLGQKYVLNELLAKWITDINYAIQNNLAVELSYQGIKENKSSTFVIHPYRIVVSRGDYYCLAYSLKRKAYRTYRFSKERMKNCVVLKNTFTPDVEFNVSDHIGQLNLIKDQTYEVKCIITGDSAIRVAEKEVGIELAKKWVGNQLFLTTIMEGEIDTISFLLSLGEDVIVREPEVIKEKLKEKINRMRHIYK